MLMDAILNSKNISRNAFDIFHPFLLQSLLNILIWPEKHFSQTFNVKTVDFDADSEALEKFATKFTSKKLEIHDIFAHSTKSLSLKTITFLHFYAISFLQEFFFDLFNGFEIKVV